MTEVIRNGKGRRTVYKRVKSDDGNGVKRQEDATEDFDYLVEIDWDAVGHLAQRAANNKSGAAVDGPLRVKITKRKTNALLPKVTVRDTNDNYVTTVELSDDLLGTLTRDNIQSLDTPADVRRTLVEGLIVNTNTASYRKVG